MFQQFLFCFNGLFQQSPAERLGLDNGVPGWTARKGRGRPLGSPTANRGLTVWPNTRLTVTTDEQTVTGLWHNQPFFQPEETGRNTWTRGQRPPHRRHFSREVSVSALSIHSISASALARRLAPGVQTQLMPFNPFSLLSMPARRRRGGTRGSGASVHLTAAIFSREGFTDF